MLNDTPVRVSVVVPTRKRPDHLREALASIRALETPQLSFEILVCDNGDGEGAEPAREFGATHLSVSRPRAAGARNAGMLAATSEYLAFLDDDDLWIPGHIVQQVAMLQVRPDLHAVVGQIITTDSVGVPTSAPWPQTLPDDGDLFRSFLHEYPQIGATLVRTSVRETVGLFDESEAVDGDEDWEWHLRIALRHRIGFVAQPGVLFRQRPPGSFDELQWARLGHMQRVLFRTFRRAGRRLPDLRDCVRIAMRHHWEYYSYFVESAYRHLDGGDRRAAWQTLLRAFRASPVHVILGIGRDQPLRNLLGALMLGRPVPRPGYGTSLEAPVVLAVADRPEPAVREPVAASSGRSGTWASQEVTR